MSTYLTTPEFVLTIQIISIVGFLFLAGYTLYSYQRVKNVTLLYIALAFAVIGTSILLKITILPAVENLAMEEALFEAMFEGTQFLAAFFFFYGLRLIKHDKSKGDA